MKKYLRNEIFRPPPGYAPDKKKHVINEIYYIMHLDLKKRRRRRRTRRNKLDACHGFYLNLIMKGVWGVTEPCDVPRLKIFTLRRNSPPS